MHRHLVQMDSHPRKHERRVSTTLISNYEVSLCEELKKVLPLDGECKPELIVGRSEILDIDDIVAIRDNILGETSWSLVYSTSLQEHSLQGLYDRLDHIGSPTTPVLMLIKDKTKHVFGALLPENIYWSAVPYEIDHVNMFHCGPFKNFHGLMEHRCMLKSTSEELSISDPEAKSGIWLNENLTAGKTEEYKYDETGKNIDAEVVETRRFQVKAIECWMFGSIPKRRASISTMSSSPS